MIENNEAEWLEDFKNPPTKDTLRKAPIFSGIRIQTYIVFHPDFKTSTNIIDIPLPPRILEIATKEMHINKLYSLLLVPYHEFILFHGIDRFIVQQAQQNLERYILTDDQFDSDHLRSINEQLWVIDKDGNPVKRIVKTEDIGIASNSSMLENCNTATIINQSIYQIKENKTRDDITDVESASPALRNFSIIETRFFAGNNGKEISSDELSKVSLSNIYNKFSVRFQNVLKKLNKINTLQDLLNTSDSDILIVRNCGKKSIDDAKATLLSLNLIDFHTLIEEEQIVHLTKCIFPFLGEVGILENEPMEKKLNTPLERFEFPIRFHNFLQNSPQIRTIGNLLEIPVESIKNNRNIGRITISQVQVILKDFFKSEERECVVPSDVFDNKFNDISAAKYDELIAKRIEAVLGDNRNSKILLMRYGYQTSSRLTLEEIGHSFTLTRERARQIIEYSENKISRHLNMFAELIRFIKSAALVVTAVTISDELIKAGLWRVDNIPFLNAIIERYFDEKFGLYKDQDYIITQRSKSITKDFKIMHESIIEMTKDLNEPIEINTVFSRLKTNVSISEIFRERAINETTLAYLAEKKKYFLVERMVYSESLYQIRFGRYLKDVLFWSMKYLGEPVHFRQLAEFVRSNNERNQEVNSQTVHSTLINSNYAHDVDRGVYALIDSKLPKYVTTWNAIQNLLKEQGPLLEDEIYNMLRMKYSNWSIQMALENHRNKLVKIGNDLYDLKGKQE